MVSGDISPNPGPEKCSICSRTVARNHRTSRCDSCKNQCHIKCGGVKPSEYKRLQQSTNAVWTCPMCISVHLSEELPFYDAGDSTLVSLMSSPEVAEIGPGHEDEEIMLNQSVVLNPLQTARQKNCKDLLLCHLNINSIQNKFEELKDIITKSRVQIMAVSETKIDASYPDSQFLIPGYYLHRNDRKKGGGGVLMECHICDTTAWLARTVECTLARQFQNDSDH